MRLRTNNIAPTVVGLAAIVVIVPVVLLVSYVVRVIWPGTAAAQKLLAAPGAAPQSRSKALWEMLQEFSHARLH